MVREEGMPPDSLVVESKKDDSAKEVSNSKAQQQLHEALSQLAEPILRTTSSDADAEHRLSSTVLSTCQRLKEAMEAKELVPLSSLILRPKARHTVYVVMNVDDSLQFESKQRQPGKFRHLDASISVELEDFDRAIESKFPQDQLVVRHLPIHAKICRSLMDVPQKNINFGSVDIQEQKQKTLTINNASQEPTAITI